MTDPLVKLDGYAKGHSPPTSGRTLNNSAPSTNLCKRHSDIGMIKLRSKLINHVLRNDVLSSKLSGKRNFIKYDFDV